MTSSNQTSKVDQIRAMLRQDGVDSAFVEQKLMDMGLVEPQPGAGGQVGGGYGMLGQIGHGMGQVARGAATGLAGLSDFARLGFLTPGLPTARGMVDQALPGAPQTRGDSLLAAAGEGIGASLPFGPSAGMMALGAGASAAGEGARQAGAGPFGQMAASAAVGMGIPIAGMALSGSIRAALAGSASRREAAKQTMALIQAGDPKAAVTLGQVAEGGVARTIEGGLRNVPGPGGVFRKTLEKQADEMGKRVEKIASGMGPATHTEVVGARARGAIEEGFIPQFKAKSEELYKRVYGLVPETAPVTPTSATILMAKQNDIMGMARELSDDITNPKFAGILEHLGQAAESGNGTIPFGVMKELRSRLGAMLSGDELVADINLRDVKRLYGALTDDMATAIQKHGGNAATHAWNRANTFTRTGHDRIEKVLQPLISKKQPEQAFTALMSGTKEGATALRSTLQSLDPGARGLVRSNVLRQLGKMPDDSFSPEMFLRKLHQLAPTARTALFEGAEGVGDDLSALAKLAEARKASGKVMFNPSGTAQNNSFWAVMNALGRLGAAGVAGAAGGAAAGGGGIGAAAGAVGSVVAGHQLASRVFTNPKAISWLVRQTKVPYGAMRQELAVLAKDAEKWAPADRDVGLELASTLGQMDWRSILMGSAVADATTVKR
jgi:hypothetical protein